MLLRSNLRLLLAQLDGLTDAPYFSSELDKYIHELREVLACLLERLEAADINKEIARHIAHEVWRLIQFLTGSTTKQIPYEVVYAIDKAAKDWGKKDLLITTAIVQEANFYFHASSREFFQIVKSELGVTISFQPVQVALPYIYRHKPLFCVPLFHELGHFFDADNEIITTSMLSSPENLGPDLPDLPTSAEIATYTGPLRENLKNIVLSHRMEYFADIISVAYSGQASLGFLKEFIPNSNCSPSHPSSTARFKLMSDFLNEKPNPIIDLFQNALDRRGLSPLVKRFKSISIDDAFGNVRPYGLSSDQEVFGLFDAGWKFWQNMTLNPNGFWNNLPEENIERITNDLIEKSLRNKMIVDGWNAATKS